LHPGLHGTAEGLEGRAVLAPGGQQVERGPVLSVFFIEVGVDLPAGPPELQQPPGLHSPGTRSRFRPGARTSAGARAGLGADGGPKARTGGSAIAPVVAGRVMALKNSVAMIS